MITKLARRVAFRTFLASGRSPRVAMRLFMAAPLEDVSKLRWQAVFLIGAGGSGKGFVGRKWMKYMPGAPSKGIDFDDPKYKGLLQKELTEAERGQTNLDFNKAVSNLKAQGIEVKPVEGGRAGQIPFKVYDYDEKGSEREIPEKDWANMLPPAVYRQVVGLKNVVFKAPVNELPSFWRQVNPDLYKEELAGYLEEQPGYVHEMSSAMAKSYFEAALETGDPLFVDGTGSNLGKMANQIAKAKAAGYKTSLVFVSVPLTVNQIRNATRSRNVKADIVVTQWKKIRNNFVELRSVADKAKVVINRNDSADIANYQRNQAKVEAHVRKTSKYDSLYDLIKAESPSELSEWGPLLKQA
jgi:predicted kinase